MTEVISLLSSPPVSPPQRITKTTASKYTITSTALYSDALDFSDGLDHPIERPSKRRKTNSFGSSSLNGRTKARSQTPEVALSSDLNLSPRFGRTTENFRSKPNNEKTGWQIVDDVDDIVFSSSAPEARRKTPLSNKQVVYDLCSDDEADSAIENESFSFSQPTESTKNRAVFSDRTMNLLASLDTAFPQITKSGVQRFKNTEKSESRSITSKVKRPGAMDEAASKPIDNIEFSSPPVKAQKKNKSVKDTSRTASTSKSRDKEAEKEKKRREKEEKAKEKQKAAETAEANRSKTNRKESVKEMLIEMSSSLKGTAVGNHVEESMKELEILLACFDEEVDFVNDIVDSPNIGSFVRWRRKVTARFDEDTCQWEPLRTPEIKPEQHVLVYLPAIEFVTIIAGNGGIALASEMLMKTNLDEHVATIRKQYKGCTPVYLIQGLQAWLKKNQTARNREFTAAVRAQMVEDDETSIPVSSQPKPRKRNSAKKYTAPAVDFSAITSETAETLLLHLQLHHSPIQIVHTTSASTTAHQISILTQHLSTRPYRLAQQSQNLKSASFCMDSGQIRTGDDAKDTYIKMLQEIQRVTPSMAYGIANAGWGNVRELVQGFRKEGNLMLEDVKKSANKDGAWSERRLGPMVSKRLYKVFMGKDPRQMDGMA